MANIALIRGAAMAAPQYTSWKDALQDGLKDYKNFRNAQAIKLERERIAYQKVMQERNKELADDFKNMTNFDPAGSPNEYRTYFTQKLDAYRNMYAQAAKEYAGDPRKNVVLNDINLKIASLKDIMDTAKQAKLDYVDRERTTRDDGKGGVVTMPTTNSKANDSFTMQLDKLRATGDFKIIDDKDNNPVAVFNASKFPAETVANYAEKKDKHGNPIFDKQTGDLIIPIGKLYSEYIPFQTQTKRYKETMQKVHDEIIPKLAKERFDRSFVDDKVNSTIDSLELTDEEKLSIAVDELGFEAEEYAGGIRFYRGKTGKKVLDENGNIVDTIEDENGNGVYDELDNFIKDSFKIGVEETWNRYNGHYAKKEKVDDSGLTQTQKYNEEKATERGEMLIKKLEEGVQSFILSISPSTEFRDVNGVVTLLSSDDDGKVVEGQQYNTNTIEGREAFLNDFARAKYGSDAQFDLIQDYIGKTLRNTMIEETGPSPTTKPQLP